MSGIDEAVERLEAWAVQLAGEAEYDRRVNPNHAERCASRAADLRAILADREEAQGRLVFARNGQKTAEALASQQAETIGKLVEGLKWVVPAAQALAGYERDNGEALPDMHQLGWIEDSRDSASFRIRVGHIRNAAALLATLSLSDEGEKG